MHVCKSISIDRCIYACICVWPGMRDRTAVHSTMPRHKNTNRQLPRWKFAEWKLNILLVACATGQQKRNMPRLLVSYCALSSLALAEVLPECVEDRAAWLREGAFSDTKDVRAICPMSKIHRRPATPIAASSWAFSLPQPRAMFAGSPQPMARSHKDESELRAQRPSGCFLSDPNSNPPSCSPGGWGCALVLAAAQRRSYDTPCPRSAPWQIVAKVDGDSASGKLTCIVSKLCSIPRSPFADSWPKTDGSVASRTGL